MDGQPPNAQTLTPQQQARTITIGPNAAVPKPGPPASSGAELVTKKLKQEDINYGTQPLPDHTTTHQITTDKS